MYLCVPTRLSEKSSTILEKLKKASALQKKPSDLEQSCAANSCTEKCSEHCQGIITDVTTQDAGDDLSRFLCTANNPSCSGTAEVHQESLIASSSLR